MLTSVGGNVNVFLKSYIVVKLEDKHEIMYCVFLCICVCVYVRV